MSRSMGMHSDNFDDVTGAFCSMVPDPDDAIRAEMIGYLAHQLAHAGPDQDQVAFRLDMALSMLEKEALGRSSQTLSPEDYLTLSGALTAAAASAYAHPPAGLGPQQVMYGLLIMAQILNFWTLPEHKRAPKLTRHLRDLARVFRNQMHNANLLNGVRSEIEGALPGAGFDPTDAMKLFIAAMDPAALSGASAHAA